ncbi:HlyU family transcriptional regulator [Pseudoroseicyclus sp. CXY001]|uniref:HlyU family transcriptional regulator n=1 Tax=Pseudoroseicyclus sp. CXY001 TaxID=3242492 RepID=UPI0035711BDA
MGLFGKLFGGGGGASGPEAKPLEYKGYAIYPEPIPDGGKHRIAARIEKEIGGAVKTHKLVRADLLDDHSSAAEAAVGKAKLMIDQQGDRIFD